MSGISKRVSGSWVSGNYGIMKTATDTLTTLPAVLYPNDTTATVGLKGNTVQNGTPTPDNPIQPQGTGDKTGNLFDKNNVSYFNGYYVSDSNSIREYPNNAMLYVPITVGVTYTISGIKRYDTSVTQRYLLTSVVPANQVQVVRNFAQAQDIPLTFTAGTDENYLVVMICGDSDYAGYGSVTVAINANSADIMLNLGSTPLPYEPYGYKIPISSANTTTPVYLGEVESTRRIKKLVFDGTENWQTYTSAPNTYRLSISNIQSIGNPAICSHFVNSPISSITSGMFTVGSTWIYIRYADVADLDDFKSYLAQQYANGTPVCVWYVLATPETGIVNEPLMRIGDYADTISDITIPVTAGGDTLSVGTTVQPSEVTVNYKGWHNATVKEWDGSQWIE